jgi:hypothetical protein
MDWQLAGGATGFTHDVSVVSRAAMRPACVPAAKKSCTQAPDTRLTHVVSLKGTDLEKAAHGLDTVATPRPAPELNGLHAPVVQPYTMEQAGTAQARAAGVNGAGKEQPNTGRAAKGQPATGRKAKGQPKTGLKAKGQPATGLKAVGQPGRGARRRTLPSRSRVDRAAAAAQSPASGTRARGATRATIGIGGSGWKVSARSSHV